MSYWTIILLVALNVALIFALMAAPIGKRTVSVTRRIKNSRRVLWNALFPLGDNAGWDGEIVGVKPLGKNRAEVSLSWMGRDEKPIRREVLLEEVDDLVRFKQTVTEDSSLEHAFWKDYSQTVELSGDDGEVLVKTTVTDSYRGAAFAIFRYFALRRSMNRLKHWAETGEVKRGGIFEHPATQFAFAVVSILLLWPLFGLTFFGLIMAAVLTAVVALHELGHMAAFRLMGHKSVRMIFIPILGGIAIGGRPYDKRFEIAFVALMGSGFSAFLIFPAIAAANWAYSTGSSQLAIIFSVFAGFCAVFNLANLAPMWRFDGGQILRQLIQDKRMLSAVSFLLLLAILAVALMAGLPTSMVIIGGVVFAILSIVTAGRSVKPRHEMKPMTNGETAILWAGLFAVIVIHAAGVLWVTGQMMKAAV